MLSRSVGLNYFLSKNSCTTLGDLGWFGDNRKEGKTGIYEINKLIVQRVSALRISILKGPKRERSKW